MNCRQQNGTESDGNGEDPGRLSTNSAGYRDPNDSNRSSVIDSRPSESSRSDQSQEHHRRSNIPSEGAKRFRMPRLKRNRGPLFPLPPKPDHPGEDNISALPSPVRSPGPPPMFRKNSAASARSANSNTSNRGRDSPMTRERSSTMGSLAQQGDRQPSPNWASSTRTSTSTNGRKSFGELFNLPPRFRQNSGPPFPRHGSPGLPGSATPLSKAESPAPVHYPPREVDDTPATYLDRLAETVPKGTIGGILARSDEEFYTTALRKYMRRFSFFGDPIDMAIRKLLMEVELPKETQQIDRFLQAFADRYHECNPGVFASPDQAYFIAFSILILHTDVFNKNNKRKMQKPDYVKNTRGEGISDDILECLYENISYTPFIHIEDANFSARQLSKPKKPLFKTISSDNLTRTSKEPVDPYSLILDDKLDTLRPSLKDVMDLDDTYSCDGTAGSPDMDELHESFAKSGILQIVSARSRPDAFLPASMSNPAESNPGLVDIKVAKVGLLWRKDARKKKTRSPWQEWGALLTFSQLYFFRDVSWVKSLVSQQGAQQKDGRHRTVVFKPPLADFKPDAIMSTDDAVALLDSGYKRHKNAFVFVRHNSLEEVFLANGEGEMNDWVAKLNYAAAFRSTGVRTKGMIAPNYEGRRYRLQRTNSGTLNTDKVPPSPNTETDVSEEFVAARKELMSQRICEATEKLDASQKQLDDALRNARHLQVMTPVHPRAREQVIIAAGRMSARLKWARQNIWRTRCYRDVLVRDLGGDPSKLPEQALVHPEDTAEAAPEPANEHPAPATDEKAQDMRKPSIPASVSSRSGRQHDRTESSSAARPGVERDPSVLSTGSRASQLASAPSVDDGEEHVLREAGLLEVDSSRGREESKEADAEKPDEQTSGRDQPSRVRRGLHRSLRDSQHGKKARESMSSPSAVEDETKKEGGGLSRKTPSFTVHGKKASIVTFGTDWQTMAPEERLKLRKPTPTDVPSASDTDILSPRSPVDRIRPSLPRSVTTGIGQNLRTDEFKDALETLSMNESPTSPTGEEFLSRPAGDISTAQAPKFNGRLAVPGEDMGSTQPSSGDESVDTAARETIQHSPAEQAVSA